MNQPKTHEEFYLFVNDNKKIIQFLLDNNLCTKNSKCTALKCKKPFQNVLKMHKNSLKYKCNSFGCRRLFSANNNIFKYKSYSKLGVKDTLKIIWYWCHSYKVKDVHEQTKISRKHIINWYNKIRRYLYVLMLQAPPMGGKGYRVQIDESLFRGRRKYNRGRYKTGDTKQKVNVRDILDALVSNNKSKRNYGNRIDGPWVFGMVLEKISDNF